MALEMAKGDPLRAKEIYSELDETWFWHWIHWRSARSGKKPGLKITTPGVVKKVLGMLQRKREGGSAGDYS